MYFLLIPSDCYVWFHCVLSCFPHDGYLSCPHSPLPPSIWWLLAPWAAVWVSLEPGVGSDVRLSHFPVGLLYMVTHLSLLPWVSIRGSGFPTALFGNIALFCIWDFEYHFICLLAAGVFPFCECLFISFTSFFFFFLTWIPSLFSD